MGLDLVADTTSIMLRNNTKTLLFRAVPRQISKHTGKQLCYFLIAVLTLSPAFSAAMMSAEMGRIDHATESDPAPNHHVADAAESRGGMQHHMYDGMSDDAVHEDQSTHCHVVCAGVLVTLFDSLQFEIDALPAGKWRIPFSLKPKRSGGTPLLQPPRV